MMTEHCINLNLSDLGEAFKYSKSLLVIESKSPFLKKEKSKMHIINIKFQNLFFLIYAI